MCRIVFPVVRQVHKLLVPDRGAHPARGPPVHTDLRRALETTERLTRGTPQDLGELGVDARRRDVNVLLLKASELARSGVRGRRKDRRGADLMGARLKGADLRGVSLRGAYLVAADLRRTTCGART
ncbi:pentapeptide repeat-containing protein [Streptomyces hirsutus]